MAQRPRTRHAESQAAGDLTQVGALRTALETGFLRRVAHEADGSYNLKRDRVWEGVAWFKDKGNRTCMVALTVN